MFSTVELGAVAPSPFAPFSSLPKPAGLKILAKMSAFLSGDRGRSLTAPFSKSGILNKAATWSLLKPGAAAGLAGDITSVAPAGRKASRGCCCCESSLERRRPRQPIHFLRKRVGAKYSEELNRPSLVTIYHVDTSPSEQPEAGRSDGDGIAESLRRI